MGRKEHLKEQCLGTKEKLQIPGTILEINHVQQSTAFSS